MIKLPTSVIATSVGGVCKGIGCPDVLVTGDVHHDSRLIQAGDLFVALCGERHDGHDFLGEAQERGAAVAVVSRPDRAPAGLPIVVVDDTLQAIARLARDVLLRLPDATVIAVTGSTGKTSTKDLAACALADFGYTIAAAGSLNNDIGLPMTVLRANERTRYLVLEMGARAIRDIDRLCQVARPDVGIVLNVGTAHAGEFGSRERIGAAKGELVENLPADGVAILNADDPAVLAMAGRTGARILTFGESEGADVRVSRLVLDDFARASFDIGSGGQRCRVALAMSGRHQAFNAAAAIAAGVAVGLPMTDVAAAVGRAPCVSRWRMEITRTRDGCAVINDAYNANPESMEAALRALGVMAGRGRTWAVLGEMRELGEMGAEAHTEVGRLAAELGIDHVVVVGEEARAIAAGAGGVAGWGGSAELVRDATAASRAVADSVAPGDVVLVKASRAVGLERVAEDVIAAKGGASDTT